MSVARVEDLIREQVKPGDLGMIISELGVVPDWSAAYTPNTGPQDAVIKIQLTDHRSLSAQEYAAKLREALHRRFPGLQFAFNTGGIVSTALNYGALSPINMQVAGEEAGRRAEGRATDSRTGFDGSRGGRRPNPATV